MNRPPQFFKDYFEKHEKCLLEDFFSFLRFKSISNEAQYQDEMTACIRWLEHYLLKLGFKTQICNTTGYPYLAAEHLKAGADKPTVLIYNHYDVQPVDPLELWHSPPFEPSIRNGEVFARGAVDNKGQCFYVLAALRALLETDGRLPLNVKLCIEGEEEVGSPGLARALKEAPEFFNADYVLIVDMGISAIDKPAVTIGCRGISTMSIELTGSNTDLHSGEHGGVAYNPLHALVAMLDKLRDNEGKILVPGFYNNIVPLSESELKALDFEFDAEEYESAFGSKPLGGESSYSPLESCWIRPTLELNGIWGGYTGEGFKTVIPAKAFAKISCRLVPQQNPQEVMDNLKNYLLSLTPSGMKLSVTTSEGAAAVRGNSTSKGLTAAREAYSEVLGLPCSNILCGGTIPVASAFAEHKQADLVMLGYGLPNDNMHAPNEHFGIDRLKLGMATIGVLLEKLGNIG